MRGADGNDGAAGAGFTGGSYDANTGIVTLTSDDFANVVTGDLRGARGESFRIDTSGELNNAQVTDIQDNSGANAADVYFFVVTVDSRSGAGGSLTTSGGNILSPDVGGGIDLSTNLLMWDGTNWTNMGQFVGVKGDTGDQGDAGAAGADGATWTSGAGAPAGGSDGDFYFKTDDHTIHKKTAGNWAQIADITGATGDAGAPGNNGADGADGAAGADGATWTSGAGAPAGGSDGDFYFKTDDHTIHKKTAGNWAQIADITGDTGPAGNDGADADNNAIANTLAANNDFVTAVAGSTANVIGAAPDGSYSDGLFSSWDANTTIRAAVDSFNEVLKSLAPSSAPYVSAANIGSNNTGVTGILTIDADTVIDAETYYAADSSVLANPDSPFGDVSKGSAYSAGTQADGSGTHRRLGVLGSVALSGKINDSVTADGVNYPADAFGYANEGDLKLYLNDNADGNPVNTLDLTATSDAFDSRVGGTGFSVSEQSEGSFSNGDPFYQFMHRTGTWHVAAASQRKGWNFLRITHTIGDTDYDSQYIEWFVDGDTTPLSVTSSSLNNLAMGAVTQKISGVEYHTSGTAQYSISVANAYKTTYSNNNVTFNGTNVSVNSIAIPAIGGDTHTKSLDITNQTATINSSSILDGSISVSADIPHPVKANLNNAGSQSISGILLYTYSDNSTVLNETFRGESRRLVAGNYNGQADVIAGGNAWDSTASIAETSDLLIYDQKLMYPTQGANGGDFSSIANGPANNVDYSGATGDRTYYRSFQNNSNSSKTTFSLSINGSGTTIVDSQTNLDNATNIQVYVKLPNTSQAQTTGWMDIATAFTTGQVGDNAGAFSGAFNATPGGGNSNTITFGTVFASDDDYIMIKIVAGQSWTGHLSNIEVDWS